jgi:hypothetical protein
MGDVVGTGDCEPEMSPEQAGLATRRSVMRGLAAGILVACFLGTPAYLAGSHNVRYYGALTAHGVAAVAVVTSTDPQNHNQACYAFKVGSRQYVSCGTADDYDAAQLSEGQVIHIVYDATNPDTSCSCQDPRARLSSERVFAAFIGFVLLSVATLAGLAAERRARRQPSGAFAWLPARGRPFGRLP